MSKGKATEATVPVAISDPIGAINKQFGANTIVRASEAKALQVVKVSTGITALDFELGGGLAQGRLHIFSGLKSSGKSLTLYKTIAANQQASGKPAAIVLTEEWDGEWAATCGVDLDNLYLVIPVDEQDALGQYEVLVKSNKYCVVALDSAPNLLPSQALEGNVGDPIMGTPAKVFNDGMKRLALAFRPDDLTDAKTRNETLAIVIQQPRTSMQGGMPGRPAPTYMPMGAVQLFVASTIIEFRQTGRIGLNGSEEQGYGDKIFGVQISFRSTKNKTGDQYREGNFILYYKDAGSFKKGEVDNFASLLTYAFSTGVIERRGAYYFLDGQKFLGRGPVIEHIGQHPELMENITTAVVERISGFESLEEEPHGEAVTVPDEQEHPK